MKPSIGYLLTIICPLLLLAMISQGQPTSDSVKHTIRQTVISRIDNKVAVGTVVAFVDNGNVEYMVYGYSDTAHKQPITPKSVFEIGSISKTFTSLLLADLVQKGKVNLNDPVDKYLPDSVTVPGYNGQKITLADLASHTSGLPRMPDNFTPKDPANPYVDYGPRQLYAFLKTYKPNRGVGTYDYSNLGVGLLGHVLSLVTGKSYEQMIQTTICKPLKMSQTSTLNTSPYLTTGHIGTRPTSHWDFDVMAGAGAIRSNAEDMVTYIKAEMGTVSSSLKPAITLTQQPIHEAGKDMKIGLGWHIRSINNDDVIWHNGGTGGYRSFAGFSKKTQKAIIILTNSGESPDDLGFYFFNPATKITPTKKALILPKSVLQAYTGVYQIAPGAVFDVKLDGDQLLVKLTGQGFLEVYPETETRFFYRVVDASIGFFKSENGEVNKLILYQNGREIPATRKP